MRQVYSINCRGKLLTTERPLVMGILNVTDDSFFDGGRYCTHDAIAKRCDQIIEEGADIIDIGAYSSRSGALDVPAEEEKRRLLEALYIVFGRHPHAIVSIDTFRADVAHACIEEGGAHIINDISAYNMDPLMLETVAKLRVPYILMHMQGQPSNMQAAPHYEGGVTHDVIEMLGHKVAELNDNGVADIIIDPGFGFGKTLDDNYELMAALKQFKEFRRPILVGISRKSMIYKLIGGAPKDALNGTTALNMFALMMGADILRVHDVKECVETVKIATELHKYM